MLEIVRYNPSYKTAWNQLVADSKNGTFLFDRNYMDYHSARFYDNSFLIMKRGKLEAVLPGHISGDSYYTHQGLTYGGLVMSSRFEMTDVLNSFALINEDLLRKGIHKVVYKPTPAIYHRLPSQEDIYALFRYKAKKIGCSISSAVYPQRRIAFNESRKSGVRKGQKAGVRIEESDRLDIFWPILNANLNAKYGKSAVHTLEEIQYLKTMFPGHIKLYVAHTECIVAGAMVYDTGQVIHVQYLSANDEGKSVGALDVLFDELVNRVYSDAAVFDFGQSTEQMGNYLNEHLIFQKEGFGGRGVVYEVYEYQTDTAPERYVDEGNRTCPSQPYEGGSMRDFLVHPTAEVQTPNVGEGTTIWQHCVLLKGARIGRNCNINYNVFVENDVVVGDNVTIKSGVQLWDGIRIEDNVFVGPNVTFTNDMLPRSKRRPEAFLVTQVKEGASIGANATIMGGLTIGCYAMIGAGSVLTRDVPDYTLWYGNPAVFKGYVCQCGQKITDPLVCMDCGKRYTLREGVVCWND